MLKKILTLLSVLIFNNDIYCATSAHTEYSNKLLKELFILTNILNGNQIITDMQKDKFTDKLAIFLNNYTGSDAIFKIWQEVYKGSTITDPLLKYNKDLNPQIKSFVIGSKWTDDLLKITLDQINNKDDLSKILPYLDILTKTNTIINIRKVIQDLSHSAFYNNNWSLFALAYTAIIPILKNSNNPLILAIQNNHFDVVKYLLGNKNININLITDEYDHGNWHGTSPLSLALTQDSVDIVAELLKHHAALIQSVNSEEDYTMRPIQRENSGEIILSWAIEKNHLKILEILASNRDFYKLNNSSIINALLYYYNLNNTQAVDTIIELYEPSITKELLKELLLAAAKRGNENMITLLLKKINIKTIYPLALIDAVKIKLEYLASILADNCFNKKIDREIKDEYGKTAMDYAKMYHNRRLISILETYTI